MKKIKYTFHDERLDKNPEQFIGLYLQKAVPTTSLWWNNLDYYLYGYNKISNYFSDLKQHVFKKEEDNYKLSESPSTAKKCPGIIDYLKYCYLVKAPCDIHVSVKDDRYIANIPFQPEDFNPVYFEKHGVNQYSTPQNNLFEDKVNLKIRFPIELCSESRYVYQQPYYHHNAPYEVIPGAIDGEHKKRLQLNVNLMLHKGEYDFTISKGDAICYILFNDKVELKHLDKSKLPFRLKTKFNGGYETI